MRRFALAVPALLLALMATTAVAVDYERVALPRVLAFGVMDGYDTHHVEFDATYGGPVHHPGLIPRAVGEGWTAVALHQEGSTPVAQHIPPLMAFVPLDEAEWVFDLPVGAPLRVRGEFLVWNPPNLGVSGAVGPDTSTRIPYMKVEKVISGVRLDVERRAEEKEK